MNSIWMLILLMAFSTVCKGVNGIGMKLAQRGYEPNLRRTLFYTWVYLTFQAIFQLFLPPYAPLDLSLEKLILPTMYGIFYMLNIVFMSFAFKEGPTSLTLVIVNFNNIFPIFYGLVFWNETLSWTQVVGLILFVAALIVINKGSYKTGGAKEEKKMTLKWFGMTMLSFLFSCFAVVCTKQFAMIYEGNIKEYLFGYSACTSVLLLPVIAYIFIKHPEDIIKRKQLFLYSAMSAAAVDMSNIVFMLYITAIASAFFFPLTSVLTVLAVSVGSWLVLKERISKNAIIGLVISAIALAFLAIK